MKWVCKNMNELYVNGIPNVKQDKLWTPFENYVPRNVFDIVGKKCELAMNPTPENWIEASKIISIYNDPRYETARYFIVKDNKITDHISITNEIPNSTCVYPHTWMLNRLRLQLEKDNSYLLFQHNHPSGYPYPSKNDINVTKYLNECFIDNHEKQRFLGHVITSNNCSSFYDGKTHNWRAIQNDQFCRLDELRIRPAYTNLPNIQGNLAMLKLNDLTMQLCKNKININNYSIGFYVNAAGYITGISTITNSNFWNNQQRIIDKINENSKKAGASSLYIVIPANNANFFSQVEDFCTRTKKIANVLMTSFDGKIVQLSENKCSSSIFHPGESVPLKTMDTRELRPKIRKLKQQKINNSVDFEIER